MSNDKPTNIVIAGLGGQGVLKCSDILAEAAFRAGLAVKKAEVHGMSQRGGSVSSDVRFGSEVWSPMVPRGEADFLVVLESTQVEPNRHLLRPEGRLLTVGELDTAVLPSEKTVNTAMLGMLSRYLPSLTMTHWEAAIRSAFPEKLQEMNMAAFAAGRQ